MTERINYHKYIRSQEWQNKRKQFYSSSMYKCNTPNNKGTQWSCICCGITNVPLDLHHKTYKRLGNERINIDLVTVCRECHSEIHRVEKEENVHPWIATKTVRKRMRRKGLKH